jgi:uncharacterized protein (TIGR02145 family)
MRSLFLLFFPLFISVIAKAQLKEFEITSLPKPEISLVQANTEFGEDALIIIYSSLTNLNFRSSMGLIDKQSYNPQSNRYEVLVRPIKQILLVYSNGFMEGTISTINPNPKDVFYFKVEEKKTIVFNKTAPGTLTINSNPTGANISLNGIPIATKTPFAGNLNPGPTSIQLSKTKYQTFDTVMNVQSSINEVLTVNLKPSTLWLNIKSNPVSAKVELDGKIIGETPLSKELDLSDKSKQGERLLKLFLTDYTTANQTIQLYPSKEPLTVNVDLKKLEGLYKIESTPEGAEVFIDGEYKGYTPFQGNLPIGTYSVELKMEECFPSTKKQLNVKAQSITSLNFELRLKSEGADTLEKEIFEFGLVQDESGNSYKTLEIGSQVWMAENLKSDRYSNGEFIPNVKVEWSNLNTGAWCNHDNSKQNEDIYGKLYNWYAVVDSRNVCPLGWHVPRDEEWVLLIDYLGGKEVAGGKMKSTYTPLWKSPNKSATNESGFSGLPGGYRSYVGDFSSVGNYGSWWSSSESSYPSAWSLDLDYSSGNADRHRNDKQYGFSVRCLKD